MNGLENLWKISRGNVPVCLKRAEYGPVVEASTPSPFSFSANSTAVMPVFVEDDDVYARSGVDACLHPRKSTARAWAFSLSSSARSVVAMMPAASTPAWRARLDFQYAVPVQ